jgi:hypothetical protein
LKVIEAAAQHLRVELHLASVQDAKLLEPTLSELVTKGIQALVVFPDGMFLAQTPLIIAFTARHRLPAMYGLREYAEVGGLMAFQWRNRRSSSWSSTSRPPRPSA